MNITAHGQKTLHKALFYIVNTVVALVFVFPLLWMVAASLKPEGEIFKNMDSLATFWPTGASLDNYLAVFQRVPMTQYILNTLFYVVVLVALDLVVNSLCGYALAKFSFKGGGLLLSIVVSLMVLPMETIMLPMYKEVSNFGWVNSYAALIIPFIVKPFSIYMFRQFFLDIPDDLIEAAAIDGCSPLRTFLKVVVPISGASYATVFILDFVAHWNDFLWPMLVVSDDTTRTVQLGIQTFFGQEPIQYGPIMAALTISAVPMVLIFLFFQKYYVKGIATTGIKE